MTKISRALTLGSVHSEVVFKESSITLGSGIARDMDRILGEKHIWFPGFRSRLQLQSRPDSELRPPYQVDANYNPSSSEWRMNFGNLKNSGQAAARTIMAFYSEKNNRPMQREGNLQVVDSYATLLHRLGQTVTRGEGKSYGLSEELAPEAWVTWQFPVKKQSLPDVLAEIHTQREKLYPEKADPLAVTAMLGSHVELGEFTDVWNDAVAQKTAILGARYLFDSGIFTPQPPLEPQS